MNGKVVGIKHNEAELERLAWLKNETSRTASGMYKFAAAKLAAELGYKPKVVEKREPTEAKQ